MSDLSRPNHYFHDSLGCPFECTGDHNHPASPEAEERLQAWVDLPPGVEGVQVRHRKIIRPPVTSRPVRLGGAEPTVIVAETAEHVVYGIYSSGHRFLGERCMPRAEFEAEFERKPA